MRSLTFDGAVVASDAMPLTWTAPPADPLAWPLPPTAITHPRTAGTFSRALRLLTRGGPLGRGGPLSLPQALAKCSLEPARLLEDRVPAMRGKGRTRSPTGPATWTARAPPPGSGMSWSTALSWCATAG
jgi:hypothetical protein